MDIPLKNFITLLFNKVHFLLEDTSLIAYIVHNEYINRFENSSLKLGYTKNQAVYIIVRTSKAIRVETLSVKDIFLLR